MSIENRRGATLLRAICDSPWAILPDKLGAIMGVMEMVLAGRSISAEEQAAIQAAKRSRIKPVQGRVAVLPLVGVIAQHMDLMTEMSGGTATDAYGAAFDAAMNDPEIGAVVMAVDSPGGSVYGVGELSDKIFNARGKKPIVAVADSTMASAAYWISSAADEIVVTPGGQVGSIGVLAVHVDESAANEMAGLKYEIIKAGKYKAEMNSMEPLNEDSRAHLQESVDNYYGMFTGAVARNRDVKASEVRGGFGEGRTFEAKAAVAEGLVDRIDTLENVLRIFISGGNQRGARSLDLEKRKLALDIERGAS